MSEFKPNLPFNVPARILKGYYTKINGVPQKNYEEGDLIFVSAKSYGGTEKIQNDKYVILDTLIIDTWYRPDITSIDGIRLLDDNSEWEIYTHPENVNRRNQYLTFKVKRMSGRA